MALKACIDRNIRAVGICDTKEHQKFAMQNLVGWVHTQNLINMANAPQKPQELIEYEKRLRTGAGQQSPATTPGQQSPATTLGQQSPATTLLIGAAVRTPVAVNANQTAEASSSMTSAIIPSPAAVVTAMPPNAAGAIRGFGAMAL